MKKLLSVIILILFSSIMFPNNKIICNKFNLVTKVLGSKLELSIDTDLPNYTEVFVGVSRYYWEKGNPSAYSVDYFSEKSTIGKWKKKHKISIASQKWKNALKAKQKEMSRIGAGFTVRSISKRITINMIVPGFQSDPRFGKRNKNIFGKAISNEYNLRTVKAEIKKNIPLNFSKKPRSSFVSLNPINLTKNKKYIVSKQTPLMPSLKPSDPNAALQNIKMIPKDGGFKVLRKDGTRSNPWYKVTAFNKSKHLIGTGWINSIALLGQKLEVYNK